MRAKILECDRQGQRAENDNQVENRFRTQFYRLTGVATTG